MKRPLKLRRHKKMAEVNLFSGPLPSIQCYPLWCSYVAVWRRLSDKCHIDQNQSEVFASYYPMTIRRIRPVSEKQPGRGDLDAVFEIKRHFLIG